MQKLILIRGLPGSGKSTLAKTYVEMGFDHHEADMFFEDDRGNYNFNPKQIKDAHAWCKNSCETSLMQGKSVVISNTFTQHWEMQDYFDLAEKYNVEVEVIVARGNFQNLHGVPEQTIQRMKARWEE